MIFSRTRGEDEERIQDMARSTDGACNEHTEEMQGEYLFSMFVRADESRGSSTNQNRPSTL